MNDSTLAPTDYTHAGIADPKRTNWSDEPVIALAPSTKRSKPTIARRSSAADHTRSAFSLDRNDAVMRTLEARS